MVSHQYIRHHLSQSCSLKTLYLIHFDKKSLSRKILSTLPRLVRQPVRIVWKFISGLVGGTSRLVPDCFPVKKSIKNRKWPFWGSPGTFWADILHLGLKNTPGFISEVVGAQNLVKKINLRLFVNLFGGSAADFFSYRIQNRNPHMIMNECWQKRETMSKWASILHFLWGQV